MRGSAEELRAMTIAETGSPLFMTRSAQLDDPVESLGWVADLAESYEWTTDLGRAEPLGMPAQRWLRREPAGVVAAITPWNVPHQINLAKLGPALAAGNTVVLKPAPDTPWCATVLGRLIAEETDIPAGVVNILPSSEPAFGSKLVDDTRVDQVSFTGSTATGRTVMAQAAGTLKRVFLELGGKSAFVVLDDAEVRAACGVAAFTVCVHAGQGCAITTRLVVPREHFDDAVVVTASALAKLPAGDPTDPGTVCGPLINARQRDRVERYIAMARAEGGEIVAGGSRPADQARGFFVEPTLIVGIGNDSPVAREEIFGPVLVVIPHDGDDDAVDIANDSPYGLSGSVWSGDRDRAMAVAGRLRTGTVGVNGGVWYSPDVPFGGYKQSGLGREMGVAGFEEYLETKVVAEPA
jgi:aldehyde dehydrogenase (NAD+)